MRTFVYSDATPHKFWNVELKGASFTVTYGRQGTAGTSQTKTFADEATARKEHDKLVAEKLKKGYTESTRSAKPGGSMRDALESALVENPDDLANHMAYADYLTEQGDALGEFIRIQLALEDEKKDAAERKRLKTQETKLRKKHQAAWLGELGDVIIDPKPHPEHDFQTLKAKYTFRRGWLDTLHLSSYGVEDVRALARSPAIRLLRHLQLDNDRFEEVGEYKPGDDLPEDGYDPQLWPLARSPYLGNVRTFILGEYPTPDEEEEADDGAISCHTEGAAAAAIVKLMPKLEELHLLAHEVNAGEIFSLRTLPNLRVLALYHNHSYPLARLAKNPAMRKLDKLLCHPHALDDEDAYIRLPELRAIARSKELVSLKHLQLRLSDMGDKGAKEVVESGLLKRLEVLDLRHGCITDKGAQALAACPDLKNLKLLDLSNNNLTAEGIRALRATGVNVQADRQWVAGEYSDFEEREYLYAGDIE
jgi:uncharacterized protein (TIGR02996 family)